MFKFVEQTQLKRVASVSLSVISLLAFAASIPQIGINNTNHELIIP
jgi:hypothetical protein